MGIRSNKTIISEMSIMALTSPAENPISVSEQKEYSRIDGAYEDTLIDLLIKASVLKCEKYVRGGFVTRTYMQKEDAGFDQNSPFQYNVFNLNDSDDSAIEIKNIQVTSIEEVAFYDTDNNKVVISPTKYRLDRASSNQPARVVFIVDTLELTNTRYFTQYEIKYTAGYADALSVPDDIKLAIMANTAMYYENREEMKNISPMSQVLLGTYRIIEVI